MLAFILFFSIFLSLYLGMHYYLFVRVADGLMLAGAARAGLRVFFAVSAVSFFAGEILSRRTSSALVKPLSDYGAAWLGVLSIGITVFVLGDIARLFLRGPAFRHTVTLVSTVLVLLLSLISVVNVMSGRITREIRIPVADLPPSLNGFSIVQISDIHLNKLTPPARVRQMVDQTNALRPDLIVMTGDLIDADVAARPELVRELARLRSPNGVIGVTGNHDFYTGIDRFLRLARLMNMTVLRGGKLTVAKDLDVVGIDDDVSAKGSRAEEDIRRAVYGTGFEKRRPVILLAHRPDTFDAAVRTGVDLQLSGHTHAGQIPPIDFLTLLFFKYPVGLYHQGDSWAYTTTGTEWWGPPMRLFSRSEIVKFILTDK